MSSNTGFMLATTLDGTLWGWGDNTYTELAGAAIDSTVPERTLPAFTSQALTFPTVSAALGQPVTLAATSDSGLPITYSISGPATLAGNQLTVTAPGTVNLIAYQSGDTNWTSTGPVTGNVTATGTFSPSFSSSSYVPATSNGFTVTGLSLNLSLDYAPTAGTVLTVLNNTGSTPITGTFANLANGGSISATYNGTTYNFTANYNGGDGNDLTLAFNGTSSGITTADTPIMPPWCLALLGALLFVAVARRLPVRLG